jgi:phosphohistidine phosphatase
MTGTQDRSAPRAATTKARPAAPRARGAGGRFVAAKPNAASNARTVQPAATAKPAIGTKAVATTKPATAAKPSPSEVPSMTSGAPASAELVELYLVRHADAGDPMAWTGDDAERPLSSKGRRQAKRLGSLLAGIKLRPDVILTSPKLRAADTAKIVGKAVSVKPRKDDRLGSSVELGDLAGLLAGNREARRVVLVGHDPDFSTLASSLTGAAIELKKGALARIDLGDAGAKPGAGALRWLVPPSVLTD